MLKTPRREPADNHAACGTHIPPDESEDLLTLCVPLAADKHERGWDPGFKYTAEDASGEQAVKAGRSGSACRSNCPAEEAYCEPLTDWHSLQ